MSGMPPDLAARYIAIPNPIIDIMLRQIKRFIIFEPLCDFFVPGVASENRCAWGGA